MTSVKDLRVNPAQMRTRINATALAELSMQVRGGIDPHLPLLVRPAGDRALTVISGHRRWLALMIAHIAYADTEIKPVSAEKELELMQATIEDLCSITDGFVELDEGLYTFLLDLVPEDLTVPTRVWDGGPEDEVLLLLRANVGAEEPDPKGQAHAFRIAIERGVSIPTLAQTVGLPEKMVEAIAAIPKMPEVIQEGLEGGTLDLEVMPALMKLNKAQRQAIAHAMKEDMADPIRSRLSYTGAVRLAALQVTAEPRILSREHVSPDNYNQSFILNAIWHEAMREAKSSVLKNLAVAAISGDRLRQVDHRWAEVLGDIPAVERYFTSDRWRVTFGLSAEAMKLLPPDVNCKTCAYALLPQDKRLKHNLEIPCRQSGFPEEGRCAYGTPGDKPFSIKLPWFWDVGAGEEITSAEALVTAWQKQWDFEHRSGKAVEDADTESQIEEQRAQIQFFMEHHDRPPFVTSHPWGTNCAVCKYYRDDSPVKSAPDAPHCQWAKGLHPLSFMALVPTDDGIILKGLEKIIPEGQGLVPMSEWEDLEPGQVKCAIPWCLQFEPEQPWSEIVPEATKPSPYSRETMVDVITRLAESVNRHVYSVYSRAALQFLTGRPEKASGNHRGRFQNFFKKQQDKLSDQQLWTLIQWLTLQFTYTGHISSNVVVPMGDKVVVKCGVMDFFTALQFIEEAKVEESEEE